MLKVLLKDSVIYGLGVAVSKGLAFLAIPYLISTLSQAEYGRLELLLTLATFFNLLMGLGLDNALSFYFFHKDEKFTKRKVFSTIIYIRTLSGVICTLVVIGGAFLVSNFDISYHLSTSEMAIVAGCAFFQQLALQCVEVFRLLFKPLNFVIISNLIAVVGLALSLFLITYTSLGPVAYVLGVLVVHGVALAYLLVKHRRLISIQSIDSNVARRVLKFGVPLLPASLSMYIITMSDRWMVTIFLGEERLAIYALAAKLVMAYKIGIDIFRKAWWPHALKVLNDKSAEDVFSQVANFYVLVGCFSAVLFSMLSPYMVALLADDRYSGASAIANVLVWEGVLYGFFLIGSVGIWKSEKTYYNTVIMGVAAVINLALNFVLIPLLGNIGAAFATVLSSLIWLLVSCLVSHRLWKVEFRYSWYVTVFCLGLVFSLAYSDLFLLGSFTLASGIAFSIIAFLLTFYSYSNSMKLFIKNYRN